MKIGSSSSAGTERTLKISWADGRCFALTPSGGIGRSSTVDLMVDCDQSPLRIRIEAQGSGDQAQILGVVVDEPFVGKTTWQKDTLCTADFEGKWIGDKERDCVYVP